MRTTRQTLHFSRPFRIEGIEEALPAGDYLVETDEELLEGLSFPAYRRVAAFLRLLPATDNDLIRILSVRPADLDEAWARERAASEEPEAHS
jgi:hypothetical protein